MIKNEVDKFIMARKKSDDESNGIPAVVNVASVVANIKEKKQCDASAATTSEESITNDRLTAFLQILFAKPNYDRHGELLSLIPAVLSDNLQEILTATTKVKKTITHN